MALKLNFRQQKRKIFTGLATILGKKFRLNENTTDLFIKTDFILEGNSRYKMFCFS